MNSWMSAITHFFVLTFFLLSIGCVPPSYREQPKTHTTNQKSYQFQYNDDDLQIAPYNDDNEYILNEHPYITHPVNYTVQNSNNQPNSNHIVEITPPAKNENSLSGKRHVIKKGETLYRISKQYAVSVDEICAANSIKDPTSIKAGQKIIIPIQGFNSKPATVKAPQPSQNPILNYSFIWPVTNVFQYSHDLQSGSRPLGITIKSSPKCSVVASASGKVVKIGSMRGYGNFIVIMHLKDFYTIYSKLAIITVKEGQHVTRGSLIGYLSDSNPNLHFQINHSGKPLNPLNYLAKK